MRIFYPKKFQMMIWDLIVSQLRCDGTVEDDYVEGKGYSVKGHPGLYKPVGRFPTFKPQGNYSGLLDGTVFCGNCGKIKVYGHRTVFKDYLNCRCENERYERRINKHGVSITDHKHNVIVTGSAFCSKCDGIITKKFKASHLACRCNA